MKLKCCVACGEKDDLQHHHLVLRSEGGGDEPSNLITLCFDCHLTFHGRSLERRTGLRRTGLRRTPAGI